MITNDTLLHSFFHFSCNLEWSLTLQRIFCTQKLNCTTMTLVYFCTIYLKKKTKHQQQLLTKILRCQQWQFCRTCQQNLFAVSLNFYHPATWSHFHCAAGHWNLKSKLCWMVVNSCGSSTTLHIFILYLNYKFLTAPLLRNNWSKNDQFLCVFVY